MRVISQDWCNLPETVPNARQSQPYSERANSNANEGCSRGAKLTSGKTRTEKAVLPHAAVRHWVSSPKAAAYLRLTRIPGHCPALKRTISWTLHKQPHPHQGGARWEVTRHQQCSDVGIHHRPPYRNGRSGDNLWRCPKFRLPCKWELNLLFTRLSFQRDTYLYLHQT